MTRKDFQALTMASNKRRLDLMFSTKNLEYATQVDALANFKQRATLLHRGSWEVAFSDLSKHLIQIQDHLIGSNKTRSESLESRFDDAHNYLDLLYALVKDAE